MKHKKRLAACLLTAALTVSTLCTGAFAWNTPIKVAHRFADVGSSDWFCGAVQTAFDKGYMSGTSNTTFVPRGATTRAAFVQTLYAKAGSPSVNSSNPFHDVKSGDWYYSAVLWASQNGITNGTSATTFSPNANVTREQLAVFLYADAGKPHTTGSLSDFADSSRIDSWALPAMRWAVQNGVISGSTSNGKRYLKPLDNATRAETATMLVYYTGGIQTKPAAVSPAGFCYDDVSDYSGAAYAVVNNNTPFFTGTDASTTSFERYSALDGMGRCDTAYANVGTDLMPTEHRGDISSVKPTGWHSVKYDIVDGKYLYNRCHLIGYQLTAENANKLNLITGTRYLNIQGMLDFENMVADYVKETQNHVLYRVTPVFEGDNAVANGVLMEAQSVEDHGAGVTFCVYCYNVQPGIVIDYVTGDSYQTSTPSQPSGETTATYILNTSSKKFHKPSCSSVNKIGVANKKSFTGKRSDLISQGYSPCGTCKP